MGLSFVLAPFISAKIMWGEREAIILLFIGELGFLLFQPSHIPEIKRNGLSLSPLFGGTGERVKERGKEEWKELEWGKERRDE